MAIFANDAGAWGVGQVGWMLGSLRRWLNHATNRFPCWLTTGGKWKGTVTEAELAGGLEEWRRGGGGSLLNVTVGRQAHAVWLDVLLCYGVWHGVCVQYILFQRLTRDGCFRCV